MKIHRGEIPGGPAYGVMRRFATRGGKIKVYGVKVRVGAEFSGVEFEFGFHRLMKRALISTSDQGAEKA